MSRLVTKYQNEIRKTLMDEYGIKNSMAVPALKKIVINVGIGGLIKNKEGKEALIKDMSDITGQRFSERKAKLSVSAFSVREGMIVGLSATLRKNRMYDFFDKFVNIVLPRLRDFRGVKRSLDSQGNLTLGFSDHTVFPEIDSTKSAQPHGFEVTFVTGAKSREKGERLLELLGMPFIKV